MKDFVKNSKKYENFSTEELKIVYNNLKDDIAKQYSKLRFVIDRNDFVEWGRVNEKISNLSDETAAIEYIFNVRGS